MDGFGRSGRERVKDVLHGNNQAYSPTTKSGCLWTPRIFGKLKRKLFSMICRKYINIFERNSFNFQYYHTFDILTFDILSENVQMLGAGMLKKS